PVQPITDSGSLCSLLHRLKKWSLRKVPGRLKR
ncbi:MAG: hypothetical protein ACI9W2_005173, partial [Gammaproteobacteria bacterium]